MGVISPTLQMEIYLFRIKNNVGKIWEGIQGTVPPSFVQCSHIQLKYLWFRVSWNIIFWCRRKVPLISMINYVHFDKGNFLEFVWHIVIKFCCKFHLWVLFRVYDNRKPSPCRICPYNLNINKLKLILTMLRMQCSFLYATSDEFFDLSIIIKVNILALLSDFLPICLYFIWHAECIRENSPIQKYQSNISTVAITCKGW
jgi:hypothetical protein